MHICNYIPVMHGPTGPARASSGPFQFHSLFHFTATASYHRLLPVNALIHGCQVNLRPLVGRAPGGAKISGPLN